MEVGRSTGWSETGRAWVIKEVLGMDIKNRFFFGRGIRLAAMSRVPTEMLKWRIPPTSLDRSRGPHPMSAPPT